MRCNKEIVSNCKNLEKFLAEVYPTHNYNLKCSFLSFLHECVSDKKCIHVIQETCQSEFIRLNTNQCVFQYKYNMNQLQRERWWRNVQPSLARSVAGTGCVWGLTGPISLDINKIQILTFMFPSLFRWQKMKPINVSNSRCAIKHG